jgi:hypothetical protein
MALDMQVALGVALDEFSGRDSYEESAFSQGFLAGWVAARVPREVTV